jgi:hypothetical protein
MRPVSTEYTSRFASMISGVPLRAIEKFSFEDFELICSVVQQFLIKEDPREFYDKHAGNTLGFTKPAAAALPESPAVKNGSGTKTS